MTPTVKIKRESYRTRLNKRISKKSKAALAARNRWSKKLGHVQVLEESNQTSSAIEASLLPGDPRPITSSAVLKKNGNGRRGHLSDGGGCYTRKEVSIGLHTTIHALPSYLANVRSSTSCYYGRVNHTDTTRVSEYDRQWVTEVAERVRVQRYTYSVQPACYCVE